MSETVTVTSVSSTSEVVRRSFAAIVTNGILRVRSFGAMFFLVRSFVTGRIYVVTDMCILLEVVTDSVFIVFLEVVTGLVFICNPVPGVVFCVVAIDHVFVFLCNAVTGAVFFVVVTDNVFVFLYNAVTGAVFFVVVTDNVFILTVGTSRSADLSDIVVLRVGTGFIASGWDGLVVRVESIGSIILNESPLVLWHHGLDCFFFFIVVFFDLVDRDVGAPFEKWGAVLQQWLLLPFGHGFHSQDDSLRHRNHGILVTRQTLARDK
jgi:hypothetical protein